MSEGRFYWLKLRRDFFKRHDVRILETAPGGRGALLILLKLMAESVDHDGCLRYSDRLPYTADMLAVVINEEQEAVRHALPLLEELGFVAVDDAGTITLTQVPAMIGSAADNDAANRQRRRRERLKEEQKDRLVTFCHEDVTDDVTKNHESKSKSKRQSKRQSKTKGVGEHVPAEPARFRPPTVEDVEAYGNESGYIINAERFVDFYASKGWKVGKNPMKDWRAAVRGWFIRDREEGHGKPAEQQATKPRKTSFHNFDQRDTAGGSWDELEVYHPKTDGRSFEEMMEELKTRRKNGSVIV